MANARPGAALRLLLSGVAIVAVAVPAIVVRDAPKALPPQVVSARQHVVPEAELPPVEPVKFVDLPPEDARMFNARVPFADGPNPAARPFRLSGGADDVARAIDCMAAAVLYEAGDDAVGERAVAQVVINRARHPAFPKTICGVVFQGSERSTGCQFTFTCDGALARKPSDAAWRRAREIATAALKGSVYKPVGYATHYHTDWVVPYWQSSLDKIAAVHTHLFFRWTGWWGTPPAFRHDVESSEPVIAKLEGLSEAHRQTDPAEADRESLAEGATLAGPVPPPVGADASSFLVTLDGRLLAEDFPAVASRTCGDRPYCKFMAWADRADTPKALPLQPSQIATMSFSYLRNRAGGYEKTLWNCQQFRRANPAQCMKVQVLMPAASPAPAGTPAVLTGVRRKGDPAPAPTPAPPAVTPP